MWVIARIMYYEEDKTSLLLKCVRPLLEDLRHTGLISGGYFLRHWHRGPHVRLYVKTEEALLPSLQKTIDTAVALYTAHSPSQRPLREEDIRTTHEWLAKHEKVDGPLFPLFPDNNVHYEMDTSGNEQYGGPVGLELARRFYTQSLPLVFDLLEESQNGQMTQLTQMFSWMMITATWLTNLRLSYISYRSHAEGFLHGFDPNGTIRAHFDQQYGRQTSVLLSIVQKHIDVEDISTVARNDLDTRWIALLEQVGNQVCDAIDEGLINLASPQHDPSKMSEFHQASYRHSWLIEYMESDVFMKRRLLLNLVYEVMLLVGIRPLEKMFLCYIAARSVEDATGTTWQEFQARRDEFVSTYVKPKPVKRRKTQKGNHHDTSHTRNVGASHLAHVARHTSAAD